MKQTWFKENIFLLKFSVIPIPTEIEKLSWGGERLGFVTEENQDFT